MKKVFAYTKEAKLSRKVLAGLEEAGYIPVPVENFDCIRLIEPIPDATAGAVLNVALKTIRNTTSYSADGVRNEFATALIDALLKKEAGVPDVLEKHQSA